VHSVLKTPVNILNIFNIEEILRILTGVFNTEYTTDRGDYGKLNKTLEREKAEALQKEYKQKKVQEEYESLLQELDKKAPRYCAFTVRKPHKDKYGLELFSRLSGVSEDLLLTVDMAKDALARFKKLNWILVLGKKTWENVSHHTPGNIDFGWQNLDISTSEGNSTPEVYVAPAWTATPAEKEKHWLVFRNKIRKHSKLRNTHSRPDLPPLSTQTLKRRSSRRDVSPSSLPSKRSQQRKKPKSSVSNSEMEGRSATDILG
jgi:hypothetical protein